MITINGNEYPIISAYKLRDQSWGNRLAYVIRLRIGFVEAHEVFTDGAAWSLDGVDHADYNVAGRITDFRDGTLEVLMGQATDAEREKAAAEAETARILPIIREGLKTLDDEAALENVEYFADISELMGKKVNKGYRFRAGDLLWRTEQPEYTFDGVYNPGNPGTESLFSRVALPSEEGTIDSPVAFAVGMEITEGLYYTENNVLYLCTRSSGQPLYNALSELVGLYVEIANG